MLKRWSVLEGWALAESTAMTLLAVALAELLRIVSMTVWGGFDHANLSLLFLLAVMASALRGGVVPGLWGAFLGLLFLAGIYTPGEFYSGAEKSGVLNLGLFVIAGCVCALIGGEAREHLRRVRASQDSRVQEARERLRVAMLSAVSHDLKTPLSAVIGSLDIYRQIGPNLTPERRNDLIDTALSEARRLDGLITNILDMAKLESDVIRYRMEWYDPRGIIENVLRQFVARFSERTVHVNLDAEGWEVELDAAMIERALYQLFDNASKHTPPHSTLHVSLEVRDGAIVYSLCDEGPGIPEQEHQSIFDKYTRLTQADRKVAGTGLGLPIARTIAQAHNGTLTLRIPPQGGACFELTLPRIRPTVLEKREGEDETSSSPSVA